MWLIFSYCALLIGPFSMGFFLRREWAFRLVDTFVMVTISGLVLLHMLPEGYAVLGFQSSLLILLGFFAPLALKRLFQEKHCQIHRSLISLATLGVISHATLDGIALSNLKHELLGFAIILHRIPEGIGIWRIVRFGVNLKAAWLSLGVLIVLTTAGFFLGQPLLTDISKSSLSVFECIMAGILLHVVFHQHSLPHAKGHEDHQHVQLHSTPSLVGALLAVLLLAALGILSVEGMHQHH